ncbi:hypothetical protein AVEN_1529-1 [Araneus ventricosus]|uniref:Uncharacterized protein n=1 Tax=Araneus ventricosus TaxID=182803 RepID=A0A4Y2FBV4_ARAVE|nr:hypothetical protein AVEN_1529-1 [Araneus ventricosus]
MNVNTFAAVGMTGCSLLPFSKAESVSARSPFPSTRMLQLSTRQSPYVKKKEVSPDEKLLENKPLIKKYNQHGHRSDSVNLT